MPTLVTSHPVPRRDEERRVIDAVEQVIEAAAGTRGTLLVEEDYRVRGSLVIASQPPAISPDVDIREANDDAVDAVIEQMLQSGGNVVFMHEGALADHGRITLLPGEYQEI